MPRFFLSKLAFKHEWLTDSIFGLHKGQSILIVMSILFNLSAVCNFFNAHLKFCTLGPTGICYIAYWSFLLETSCWVCILKYLQAALAVAWPTILSFQSHWSSQGNLCNLRNINNLNCLKLYIFQQRPRNPTTIFEKRVNLEIKSIKINN